MFKFFIVTLVYSRWTFRLLYLMSSECSRCLFLFVLLSTYLYFNMYSYTIITNKGNIKVGIEK